MKVMVKKIETYYQMNTLIKLTLLEEYNILCGLINTR